MKESVAPDSQIGSKVPVFTAKSQDGKSVTLTDLCQGKKYVLIDFGHHGVILAVRRFLI